MIKIKQRMGWGLIILLILGIGIFMIAPYLRLDPATSRVALDPSFSLHYTLLVTHIFLAFIALVLGPFQFIRGVRQKSPGVHRAIGRIYLICVLMSGIAGFGVGLFTIDFTRQTAFLMLDILWLLSAWKAYRAIRLRRIVRHSIWMTRNYALTLVAVVARIIVPLSILVRLLRGQISLPLNISEVLDTTLGAGVWLALVLNIVLVEWLILRQNGNKVA